MQKRVCGPAHCAECPFKSRTVGNRGPEDASIVIVGESPGSQEVRTGVPFIGPSGKLLSILLKEAGIDEREVLFTNTLQCLPPRSKDAAGNRVKDGVLNDAARACRGRLMELIESHPRDLIIAMGSAASRALSEKWNYSITKSRGQVLEVKRADGAPIATHNVLPTFHPAYILRNPSATPQVRIDLQKAKKLLSGFEYPKPEITYKRLDTISSITRMIVENFSQRIMRGLPTYAIADIESTGLDRFKDRFRCIGIIPEHKLSENGNNIVYIINGNQNGKLVRHLFNMMPKPVNWVWHNGKFDTSFLRAKGIPRDQARVDEDTLLLSYTLDETGARHSLEQCIMDHLGLPAYKDKLATHMKETGTTYATVDTPHLYQYCAEDVTFTGLLFRVLSAQVRDGRRKHLERAYRELLIPASNALATIELNGMPIDQKVLCATEEELQTKLEAPLSELQRLAVDSCFNPNSPKQTLRVLQVVQKLKVHSTDEDTLKKHKDNPFVKALLAYRESQKSLSTYITAFKKYGSRVHTSYLIHGTVTGRLSSSSPNMQNIPKEGIVRRHFRTTKGRVFVSFDYSQAELRSLAVLSGDKNLIDIFNSGKDMHSAVAADMYGKEFTDLSEYLEDGKTENPVYGKLRRNAKTVNFGIVYGVTEWTLMERLGITWDEAHKLIISWFSMFPDAKRYMEQCRHAPILSRPLITVFGRQRRFYVVADSNRHSQENEAGNFPHQSMCSDFTLASAIEIDTLHAKGALPGNACQVNIIHDDNLFEIDDDDQKIVKLVNTVRPIMENIPVRKGIDTLKFKVDAKKGNIWSELQKIKGI